MKAAYLRNFVFGVEDSLVSTVGLVSGIAIAGVPKETIFVTGVILILVEAVSMSAGSFLSESSVEDYETKGKGGSETTMLGAIIMLFSYAISGLVPLLPYLFFSVHEAFRISILSSLLALMVLGVVSAQLAHVKVLRSALRMVLVGGAAIAIGVIAGHYLGT